MFPYIGGKAHHIRHLDPVFPIMFDTFVDVFGGAGWVSVKSQAAARASTKVYNDKNPYLANIFYWLSKDPTAVRNQLLAWPEQNESLYRQFQHDVFGPQPAALDLITAAKYLYLEVQSFTGNTLGLNSSIYFDKTHIHGLRPLLKKLADPKICNRLQQLTVENLDCVEVIKKYDSATTFFYVDPPYYKKEHYYTESFAEPQHRQLADCLKQIQGQFALSYYEFPELLEWFPENKFKYYRYSISKQNSSRNNKQRGTELVISN